MLHICDTEQEYIKKSLMNALSKITPESIQEDLRYLYLLSRSFRTIAAASTEIINLEAILNLPKGTEHFLSDLHGEYEAFQHVLKNASGTVRRKVDEIFGQTLRESVKRDICTLIYYPKQKLQLVKEQESDLDDWYMITLNQLVQVCQNVSSKYTRSKVRKSLPREFSYIIQELLHESSLNYNKQAYTNQIIFTIISTRRADQFIEAMCNLIQRLVIDSLHIVGDIYDRGNGAHIIMDTLNDYHNFDIQWGNHDLLWMGAASGNVACMCNALRISLRYANLATFEDGYGINLLPLATFALEVYGNDPCTPFAPKISNDNTEHTDKNLRLMSQMHKAISIIQFKVEAALIKKHPEFEMSHRLLLDKMDLERGVVTIEGKEYALNDTNFPTVDPNNPYALTPEEADIVDRLHNSFTKSEGMKKHMNCLLTHGSMYLVVNNNLLFHASIPLDEDGNFKHVMIQGKAYKGKSLLDKLDRLVREAYYDPQDERSIDPEQHDFACDYMWYLWCGKDAAPFDKSKMATFENYFCDDKEIRKEVKGHFYKYRDCPNTCDLIFREFGMEPSLSHIITGHVPVKHSKGESPLKADGKLLVIDGGFSRAYQPTTGIAGYTLVYHSRGLQLVQHEPFMSRQQAIAEGRDIKSTNFVLEFNQNRMCVRDTDKGKHLEKQIEDLKKLLVAYRIGLVKER